MSLISVSRSVPAEWMFFANSICLKTDETDAERYALRLVVALGVAGQQAQRLRRQAGAAREDADGEERIRAPPFRAIARFPSGALVELVHVSDGRACPWDRVNHVPRACRRPPSRTAFVKEIGGDLLSREVALRVPSALAGLTSLFGMGRGVSPPV